MGLCDEGVGGAEEDFENWEGGVVGGGVCAGWETVGEGDALAGVGVLKSGGLSVRELAWNGLHNLLLGLVERLI